MEVHAHTHTPRKKWTHYFWEFLMLFLAVFCGFLAENQREHIVEGHRAKDYAKSLLNDLKEDTAELTGGIRQNAFMNLAFDSCIAIGMKNTEQSLIPGTFYYYSRFANNAYAIDWNTSTLTQLLQSGNLRYFKNKELITKISKYYYLQGLISKNNETDLLQRNQLVEIRNRLLSAKNYKVFAQLDIEEEMKSLTSNDLIRDLMSQEIPYNAGSDRMMETFLNTIIDRRDRNKRFVEKLYPRAFMAATELIALLKKEFHLKD